MKRPTPRGRRTAGAVGVVALLAASWWVVRAPVIETHAIAPPPDIDIDPPAMRARREAAIALATMPSDPWTFAESLAASAPDEIPVDKDCGIDGRPAFGETGDRGVPRVPTTAASSRFAGAQARIDAALRSSLDPFDRAVADWLDVGGMRGLAGRDEAVVQQAAVSSDARLYALGYGLCHANRPAAPSCAAISLERWIDLDADNGIPWMTMLERARSRGDGQVLATALAHLAAASRFDTYRPAVEGAVARRAPSDEGDLAAVNDLALEAGAEAEVLPAPESSALMAVCRGQGGRDPELARICRSISDTMFAHSDDLSSEFLSGILLLEATGDESRRDSILAERALATSHWSPATGFSECRDMRGRLHNMVRVSRVGEVEALRERARRFVPP